MEITDIYKLYEYFSTEIAGDQVIYSELKLTKSSTTLIKNFIKELDSYYKGTSSLGTTFLWNYFTFQYNYWADKNTQFSYPEIHLILGDKAMKRWFFVINAKQIPYLYFIKINLLKKYPTLQYSYIEKLLNSKQEENKESTFFYQESQRKLFLNTPRGFHNCYYHTDMFDEKSIYCPQCTSNNMCIKIKNNTYDQV